MAMGRRRQRQESLFIPADGLPKSLGHPFYRKLNRLLAEAEFDRWVENRCQQYYEQQEKRGQPSIPPGVYFRMLLVGYFEGIGSQRGIAWRCADSLSLREFMGIPLDEDSPDHSTLTNTRKRLPREVFEEVFQFVLRMAVEKKLLGGKTVGVDSTTLEADAAMKSIVRRDTGEDWREYVTRLMREEGVIEPDHQPTDEEIRRYDKKRKNKKVSNEEWGSPNAPESGITQLKDGRTHAAYKSEHVVDLDSELVIGATLHPGHAADTDTLVDSVMEAQENLDQAGSEIEIEEAAADKGYHAASTLELCDSLSLRTYIPERRSPHGLKWTDKEPEMQRAVYLNRQRVGRTKSKRLQRRRSEVCERTFAHICDTGGMRRIWLSELVEVTKRYLIAVAAHNLGRIMRKLFGTGKPKALQGAGGLAALVHIIMTCVWRLYDDVNSHPSTSRFARQPSQTRA
jgi:transposase